MHIHDPALAALPDPELALLPALPAGLSGSCSCSGSGGNVSMASPPYREFQKRWFAAAEPGGARRYEAPPTPTPLPSKEEKGDPRCWAC